MGLVVIISEVFGAGGHTKSATVRRREEGRRIFVTEFSE